MRTTSPFRVTIRFAIGRFLLKIIWHRATLLSTAVLEIFGPKYIGVTSLIFRITAGHRSRDYSVRHRPFPIGDGGPLFLSVFVLFGLKPRDAMLNRHCACVISRDMYPYVKFKHVF